MELKTELTLVDKLKSWKRWVGVAASVLPIILQAATGAVGWPVAVVSAVAGAIALILGLAHEDSARLKAVGMAIAAAIAKGLDESDAEPDNDPLLPDDNEDWSELAEYEDEE